MPPDEHKRWAERPLAQIAYIVEGEARTKRGAKLGVVTTHAVSTPNVRGVRMNRQMVGILIAVLAMGFQQSKPPRPE